MTMGMTRVGVEQLKGVAKQFPPFFSEITPNFTTPNTQIEATIKGEFFTPDMIVTGGGFTVNNFIFIDTKTVKVFIMTASIDGNYNLILNNNSGIITTKTGIFTVSQGNVIIPTINDWTPISPLSTMNFNISGEMIMTDNFSAPKARWNQILDTTRKFRFTFSAKISPFFSELTTIPRGDNDWGHYVKLFNADTNAEIGGLGFFAHILRPFGVWTSTAFNFINLGDASFQGSLLNETNQIFTFEWDLIGFKVLSATNTVLQTLNNPSLISSVPHIILEFKLWQIDIDSIKYIELP